MSNIRTWLAEKSSEEREHFLGESPRLCLEGRRIKNFCRLLNDFDFIEAKINHPKFGVQALIEDYDLIDDARNLTHLEYDAQTVKALKLIQRALRLSAHNLIQDRKQLAGQLLGRLLSFNQPEIQTLLQQAKQWEDTPWLRPLEQSLMPADGRLIRTLTGHSDDVLAVAITPDGKYVISASMDKMIKVWNWQAGEEVRTLAGHSDGVLAVAITPDGKYVISASMDKMIKVWNWQTGEEVRTLTSHNHWVFALAVTPDGKYLISGSTDTTIKVWNIETGEILYTLKGHWREVRAVAVTPDGKKVISGSEDNTLKVWNLKTGRLLFTLRGQFDVALKVLRVLICTENGGEMSAKAITQIIDEDEYDVEEVVENWLEFLQQQRVGGETRYSFYHSSFRVWLAEQISNS